jgi:hypothetical protein
MNSSPSQLATSIQTPSPFKQTYHTAHSFVGHVFLPAPRPQSSLHSTHLLPPALTNFILTSPPEQRSQRQDIKRHKEKARCPYPTPTRPQTYQKKEETPYKNAEKHYGRKREKRETIQTARNHPEEDKKEFLLNLNRMSYPTTPQYSTKTSLFYNPTPPKKMPWFDGVRNAVVCAWFVEWIC